MILRAQAFLRFTDIYGPFPLSMNADNTEVYTSQRDIYLQLIKDLNEATTYISSDTQLAKEMIVFAPYDLVYKGDFNKWRKFANSLKLRIAVGQRKYIGCRAGAAIGSNIVAKRLYSTVNVQETTPSLWLTASEMAFCKAEGVLRGWNMGGGTAKEYYERGVTLSFNQWGADGVATYLLDDTSTEANYADALGGFGGAAAKASTITIKWDDHAPMDEKMERLITQKWIALFPNGQEAWNEIRRTGYPRIFSVPQATNGYTLLTPNRIPFDKNQQINNRSNYDKAVELLGGPDDYATPMWWQR